MGQSKINFILLQSHFHNWSQKEMTDQHFRLGLSSFIK